MLKAAHTMGTRTNHQTHSRAYLKFCKEYEYAPFPATEWRYCQFAQYLASQDKVPETVDNYCSTVRLVHRLENLPVPEKGQIHFRMVSEGLKKTYKKPVWQAYPITQELLLQIFHKVDFRFELQVVAWVAVLVAFTLLLCVSNLGPRTRGLFSKHQHFLRSDYVIRNGWPTIGVQWSKTVQHRNGVNWAPLVPAMDRRICPQHWVKRMIQYIPTLPR